MSDKRRYLSRNPSPRRDPIVSAADHETGDAGMDGFTVRARQPQPGRPNPHRTPRMSMNESRSDASSSCYGENFASDTLMDENEARYGRLYPSTPY